MALDHQRLNDMRDGAEVAATVAAAAQVGLFEGLRDRPSTPADLARRLGLDARAVRVILLALADLELVGEAGGTFSLETWAREHLGNPGVPGYVGGGLPLWLTQMRMWTRLPEVLRRGGPLDERVPEVASTEARAQFAAAMAAQPPERIRRLVDRCLARGPGARTALDLGGGPGHVAREFVRRGLHVTLFDRPETIEHVAPAFGLAQVANLELVGADFMTDSLPRGPFDVVLLGNVCHIYSAEENRALIARVRPIVAPNGLIAIADFVRGRSPRAARFAVLMLLRTTGGDTYGEGDYRAWLEAAGFADVTVDDVDADRQVITAMRR